MKFTIIAVGKLKERFWTAACDEYLKRLGPYARTNIVELADSDPSHEEALVLRALPERAHVVLLAIDGSEYSSEQIAARIDDLALNGTSEIAFVIGGSCGVTPAVRSRADELWSFGRITLPHNLARVVLLEQLYRSRKISRGEPYHK